MTLFAAAILLSFALRPAAANGASIWWPGWRITSSEELSQGVKYGNRDDIPTYPLSRLFDGDPNTSWVYSATQPEWDRDVSPSRYGIAIEHDTPFLIDGLRIMNGQNESPRRFAKNNRVVSIRVTLHSKDGKIVRTFKLPDKMGWHNINLPTTKLRRITIEFTGITAGPAHDLCISELELLFGGRKIDLHMPRAVMYYNGLEGCGAFYLILPTGKMLDGIAMDAGFADEWSPSNRYVSGIAGPDIRLWFADVTEGRIISHITSLKLSDSDRKWEKRMRANARKAIDYERNPGGASGE